MKEFLRLLFVPCDDIAVLASDSLDRDLPRSQRLAVSIHLLYCKACRRYRRQIRFLRHVLRTCLFDLESRAMPTLPSLTPAARERIRQSLTKD